MLRYEEYTEKDLDTCDIYEEQVEYLAALGLTRACTHLGK